MKTSNYSLDIILEIVEDAPEMAIVYFQVATEEMEGRVFEFIEIVQMTDIDGDDIEHEPHTDDLMKAINDNRDKWSRYD